jgi:hypothetical protein
MFRYVFACSILLAGCEAGVTQSQYGQKQVIDCTLSPVSASIPGRFTCEQFAKNSASTGDRASSAIFQKTNWFGTAEDGSSISIQVNKALMNGFVSSANPKFSYEQEIQDFNSFARAGRNWSRLKSVAGAKVMTFIDDGSSKPCFGFYMIGGNSYQGAAYSVRGMFCRPSSRAAEYSDDAIAALLGKIEVRS